MLQLNFTSRMNDKYFFTVIDAGVPGDAGFGGIALDGDRVPGGA